MKPLLDLNLCRNEKSGLRVQTGKPVLQVRLAAVLLLVILIGCIGPRLSRAQVVPPGDQGGARLWAGAMGSGYSLQFVQSKMAWIAGFVDLDTKRRLGIEAEGRWLEYFQTANVHAETYSIGGRYHFDVGRFQPYAKGLVGFGDFNFPYNYAYGRYLVVTAGGGLDFHWTHRIYVRAVDFEYQDWPNFTFGNMNSFGVNAGLRVRIF